MTITTITDSLEVAAIMLCAGINPADIKPVSPADSCYGITDLWPGAFLIITNERGAFRLVLIEQATRKEAWAKFDEITAIHRTDKYKHGKPRAVMIGHGKEPGPLN